MADVFLSYDREDRTAAELVALALVQQGYDVWWDPHIPAGPNYTQVIEEALGSASCVVVLWSAASVTSCWVQDEAREGAERGVLVAARVAHVKPPLGFRGHQLADLTTWDGSAEHSEFKRLLRGIERHVAAPAGVRVELSPRSDAAVPSTRDSETGQVLEAQLPDPLSTSARDAETQRNVEPSTAISPDSAEPRASATTRVQGSQPLAWRTVPLAIVVIVALAAVALLRWGPWARMGSSPPTDAPRGNVHLPSEASSGQPPSGQAGRDSFSAGAEKPGAVAPTASAAPPSHTVRFRVDAWNLPNDELWGFVEIPAGSFTMGSTNPEFDSPIRSVTLPAYFLGKYEVTTGQYRACLDDGGCSSLPADSYPVVLKGPANLPVRWLVLEEALQYADWLDKKLRGSRQTPTPLANALLGRREGDACRITLPTEAEWERAARGTSSRRYPWGNSAPTKSRGDFKSDKVYPVGAFPEGRTPEGVFDMLGNVSEMTRTVARSTKPGLNGKLVRGNSTDIDRRSIVQGVRAGFLGFRLVCSTIPGP